MVKVWPLEPNPHDSDLVSQVGQLIAAESQLGIEVDAEDTTHGGKSPQDLFGPTRELRR